MTARFDPQAETHSLKLGPTSAGMGRWMMRMIRGVKVAVAMLVVLLATFATAEEPDTRSAGSGGGSASSAYVVVLANGSMVPAKSKPLSAFGSFRFVDVSGRTRVYPVSEIDIDATRKANADVPDDPTRGTLSIAGPAANQAPQVDQNGEAEEEAPKAQTVTVYSATWCGYCKDLKRYLASRNIPASIIEVDLLPAEGQHSATATMKRLTGRVAYPTVVIGGDAQAGFSRSWIEARLAR